MNRIIFLLLVSTILLGSCKKNTSHLQPPPMVDGNIDDFINLGIEPINLSQEVDLYIFQDKHYVWFGYTYPKGSYGLLDLELITPKLKDTLRIHVSAQLGEWPLNNPDLIPKNPESELWWNMDGWIANEVWLNGMDRTGDSPRYNFRNGDAREIQFSKNRFGVGKWGISFHITNIKGKDDKDYSILYPNDSSYLQLNVH